MWFGGAAACLWFVVLFAPWRPWSTRERLEASPDTGADQSRLDEITAVVPARNEAALIEGCLHALRAQGTGLRVLVVDDQSTDATATRALRAGAEVLSSSSLPDGWTGKLWALEQGYRRSCTRFVLLLDADIIIAPGVVATLCAHMRTQDLQMASLMAAPRLRSFWERLLLPAFVYFFKLLYPFRLANSTSPHFAAAAGGCVLVERRVLDDIGGFGALRGAIIDDCTLARLVKRAGFRTWIGLTRGVRSERPSPYLADIWHMVARTAFTQLRYSGWLLAACTLLMLLAFAAPIVCLWAPQTSAQIAGFCALCTLCISYLPVLSYYGLSPLRALTLPLAALLFLAMTWSSALRYWRGTRSSWKGRSYVRERNPTPVARVD
jgi:hopene-associated glycosyltransferase HpnB